MSKPNASYETVMVITTKDGEEATTSIFEKFESLIESNGTIESVDNWGKRRLAYEIQDQLEGHYVLVNFTCPPEFPAELDRVYKITDGILRSLIVAK